MIPGDIGSVLAGAIGAAVRAGELPPAAATLRASGTWRHARGLGPGSYATSMPFELGKLAGIAPERAAAQLAEPLSPISWVAAAETAGGYLTIRVTAGHLAALPGRVISAGPAAARSDALAGHRLTAPHLPELASSASWAQAWRSQHEALAGRLAAAAGADVHFFHAERNRSPDPTSARAGPAVASDVAYYGADVVRYALARATGPEDEPIRVQCIRPLDLSNPYVVVRWAHADAASTARWAAGLGLSGITSGAGRAPKPAVAGAGLGPPGLEPPELELLDAISWLPERVAVACRRRRPAHLVAHLEYLAGAWLDCAEKCPALPFRGRTAPAEPGGVQTAARLELATAARTALAAGLGLLGVAAPARATDVAD